MDRLHVQEDPPRPPILGGGRAALLSPHWLTVEVTKLLLLSVLQLLVLVLLVEVCDLPLHR